MAAFTVPLASWETLRTGSEEEGILRMARDCRWHRTKEAGLACDGMKVTAHDTTPAV